MDGVEILQVDRVYEGFLSIDVATVRYRLPGGDWSSKRERSSLERGDAVAVILHNVSRDRLLFVRQFRYACLKHEDAFPLEIVAGAIDSGESPADAARREVEEEVGYVVKDLHFAHRSYSSPGITSEMLHIFYAEVRDQDRRHLGNMLEGEDLLIEEIPIPDVWRMLDEGQILDGKSLIGLQWLRWRLAGRAV